MNISELEQPKRDELLSSVRVTTEELELIVKNANKFAGGNISRWVRSAAIHFKPEKKPKKGRQGH